MGKMLKLSLLLATAALALAPVGAPFLTASHPLAALLIRGFFSRLCHQDPSRSFQFQGSPVAVCIRCLGIYCGVVLGGVAGISRAAAERLLSLALLLTLVDVATAALHWHGNLPGPRFVLGLLLGTAAGALLFRSVEAEKGLA